MEETVISFGGEIKSLDNGHFGGYLVRFTDPKNPDLTGDYFTKETDFGISDGQKTPVYFHHRQPLKTRDDQQLVIKAKIGEATLSIDDEGVLIDAVIYNREKYEQAIIKAGKSRKSDGGAFLGWSSGTAAHTCDREQKGGANFIKFWQLGFDASLTPTPCDPVNEITSLKGLTTIKFLPLDEIEVVADEASKRAKDHPNAEKPVELKDAPMTGAQIYQEARTEQTANSWQLESAYRDTAREIAQAAASQGITGVRVDVSARVTEAANAYATDLATLTIQQINDYLESESSDPFYLKSIFDELTSDAPAASKFADHLQVVLAAAREVTQRAKQINGMRIKAGRAISADRRSRLSSLLEMCRNVADEIDALLKETEPPAAKTLPCLSALRMQTLRLESKTAGVPL
jgi:hypothetical protein